MAFSIAVDELQLGRASRALCGGSNICLTPITSIGFVAGGYLSKDGRCKSFDESADGYARAEAAGVAVLSSVTDAEASNLPIRALVRHPGVCVNNGRSNPSIASPAADTMKLMIDEALRAAGMNPFGIDYVECHGTGTKEGDAAEGHAVASVLGCVDRSPLLLGSIKSNMGHAEAASGIVGVFNLSMMLHNQTIVPLCPAAHKQRTSNIDWEQSCMLPSTVCQRSSLRAGGVSY